MKTIDIKWKDTVHTVKVDDGAHEILARHTWYIMYSGKDKRPYAFTEIFSKTQGKRMVYMHHLVLGAYRITDHANGDSLDNQFDNLRPATSSQNGINTPKFCYRDGTKTSSKYKGVSLVQGKFRAAIRCTGKTYSLGCYDNEDDAGRAYNVKAKELYGDFAWMNPVPEINGGSRSRDTDMKVNDNA